MGEREVSGRQFMEAMDAHGGTFDVDDDSEKVTYTSDRTGELVGWYSPPYGQNIRWFLVDRKHIAAIGRIGMTKEMG